MMSGVKWYLKLFSIKSSSDGDRYVLLKEANLILPQGIQRKNINPKIKYPLQTLSGRYCIKFRQVRWKIRN
jgi:hypothetical protein